MKRKQENPSHWKLRLDATRAAREAGLCQNCTEEAGIAASAAANGSPRLPYRCAKCKDIRVGGGK